MDNFDIVLQVQTNPEHEFSEETTIQMINRLKETTFRYYKVVGDISAIGFAVKSIFYLTDKEQAKVYDEIQALLSGNAVPEKGVFSIAFDDIKVSLLLVEAE